MRQGRLCETYILCANILCAGVSTQNIFSLAICEPNILRQRQREPLAQVYTNWISMISSRIPAFVFSKRVVCATSRRYMMLYIYTVFLCVKCYHMRNTRWAGTAKAVRRDVLVRLGRVTVNVVRAKLKWIKKFYCRLNKATKSYLCCIWTPNIGLNTGLAGLGYQSWWLNFLVNVVAPQWMYCNVKMFLK